MQSHSSTLEARYQARIDAINTRLSLRNCNWCKIENEISALDEAITNLSEPELQTHLFAAFYDLHVKAYGTVNRKSISALLGYASACLGNNNEFKSLRLLTTAYTQAVRLKGRYSHYALDIQGLVNDVKHIVKNNTNNQNADDS